MKEQIKRRIALWKKIFAKGNRRLGEETPWLEILSTQNFDYEETVQRVTEAVLNYGGFTQAEIGSLNLRPHYEQAKKVLEILHDINGFWFYSSPLKGGAYLEVRLLNNMKPGALPVYEAKIVTDEPVDLTDDFYLFFGSGDKNNAKSVVLRYAKP